MRTVEEIMAEIVAFEAQFRPEIIPAGTPNRKQLQEQARQVAHQISCRPENVDKRWELLKEMRKAKRSENAKRVAAIRKSDPEHNARQKLFRELRKLGFKRYTTSGKSAYYEHETCGLRVRVSDHSVPMTPERIHNMNYGGRSWADSQWSHVIGEDDSERFLESIRDRLSEEEVTQ